MNNMKSRIIGATIMTLAMSTFAILPAFAQSGISNAAAVDAATASLTPTTATGAAPTSAAPKAVKAGKAPTQAQRLAALGARGDKEIQVRIDSLNKLVTRIQDLRNVSDAQKASIITTLQGLITNLNTLDAQIASADLSSTTLKESVKSITENYRVYALAIPQLNLFAASDRITTVINMMSVVGGKLQTRLAGASGVPNMAALQADLNDFAAKLTDANTQISAAVSEFAPLTPDQGDKTKMAANTAALKDARTKVQAAQKDVVAARKDAQTIINALVKYDKGTLKPVVTAPTTGTTTGTTTP